MASVDWQKADVQMVGAMIKHCGEKERVENNHSNKDIDKSKSHLNIYIGADDWSVMADKVKKRVEEVDKEHPPLRDTGKERVTCFLLETPVPQEIAERGKAAEFLRKAHKVLEDFFGAENVGGTVGHFDEQHYYIDKDGKERLSLIHGHSPIAAYVEWTEDVKKNVKQPDGRYKQVKTGETRERCGINGKNCESKTRLKALNKAMDEMCRREYGISYNTAETPERKSVERLKEETALRETAAELQGQVRSLSEKVNDLTEQAEKLSLSDKKGLTETKSNYQRRQALHTREQLADEREQSLDKREQAVAAKEQQADRKMQVAEYREQHADEIVSKQLQRERQTQVELLKRQVRELKQTKIDALNMTVEQALERQKNERRNKHKGDYDDYDIGGGKGR